MLFSTLPVQKMQQALSIPSLPVLLKKGGSKAVCWMRNTLEVNNHRGTLPFLRNWQSLRRSGGNTLNSMEIPAFRNRTRGPRRVMHTNALRIHRIAPQAHADLAEGVDIWQCVRANRFGQDDNRLMGEKLVTARLTHRSPPVRQLEFKSACTGTSHLNESLYGREDLVRKELPCHRQHVCDSVSIHSNFARNSHAVIISRAVHFRCLKQIGPCKRKRESVLGGCHTSSPRQIPFRLRKTDFRNNDSCYAHRFVLGFELPIIITRSSSGLIAFDIYTQKRCALNGMHNTTFVYLRHAS